MGQNNQTARNRKDAECRKFGQRLRHLRLTRGQMPSNVARLMGCRTQTIEALEDGSKRPTKVMVYRLSRCLDLSPVEEFELLALAHQLPPTFFTWIQDAEPLLFSLMAIFNHQGVTSEDKEWLRQQIGESVGFLIKQYGLDRNPADEPDIVIPIEPTIHGKDEANGGDNL